ncbi:hypothetical protein [Streptomyces sp. NBC_01237]|uniref:hypothetical protein n=1 Tax=Streptomyces sp. NBC_01237 TaxID=2903790 RepID=UPI002DD7C1B1|nr:hypothetical protein [Streptomyces sp. NBC_01237]WRZ70308.1 hypothetical protein OG251_00975 [Streptomyces sp. NBC_01237]
MLCEPLPQVVALEEDTGSDVGEGSAGLGVGEDPVVALPVQRSRALRVLVDGGQLLGPCPGAFRVFARAAVCAAQVRRQLPDRYQVIVRLTTGRVLRPRPASLSFPAPRAWPAFEGGSGVARCVQEVEVADQYGSGAVGLVLGFAGEGIVREGTETSDLSLLRS